MKKLLSGLSVVLLGATGYAQCNYTLKLKDTFGDGWNGNTIDVLVNGQVVLDDVTMSTGSELDMPFSINNGDMITTIWNGGGSFGGETSYEILDPNGVVVGVGEQTNINDPIEAACPSCIAPSNVTQMLTGDTSVNVSWTPAGNETMWNIEYGTLGYTQGSGTLQSGLSATSYELTGLTPDTSYSYYLQSDCGSGDTSIWVGPFNFYTGYCRPSSTANGTYINSFTTSGAQQDITNVSEGYTPSGYANNSSSVVESFAGGSFDFVAEIVGGTVGYTIWVDWNKDFVFDNETEKVYNTTSYSNGPFSGTISVPIGQAMGDYRIRMVADFGALNPTLSCARRTRAEYEDFTLRVGDMPSCVNPAELSATNITGDSADLSWTPLGSETMWNVEYGLAGFTQGSGTVVAVDSNPYTLTGLNGSSSYEFYVQANCGSETSIWSGPYTFKTACVATVPNYTYDFSDPDILLNCWLVGNGGTIETGPESYIEGDDANAFPSLWRVDGFLNDGNTGARAFNFYSQNRTGWLITPNFDLSGGGDYELTFDYGVTNYYNQSALNLGSDDEFKLLMSEDGGTTWTEIQTWTAADNISNTLNSHVYTINSTSSNVKFAFYGTDGAIDDSEDVNLYIDNVKVTDTSLGTSEVAVRDLEGVQVYPNPFTDVLNINDVKGVERITVLDMSGRVVKTFEPTNTLNLGSLNSGLYLISLSYEDGTVKTVKAIKK